MKRKLMYLALAVFCTGLVVSCEKNDNDSDDDGKTKVAKVKKISFDSPDWKESWEFVYDENGKTTRIYNSGEDLTLLYLTIPMQEKSLSQKKPYQKHIY
ncbi:MAG: hypothetical protein LBH34_01910 [Prevotellaceae bacterium]|jgi:hypothetical protein|nr:hypothetical protein [Prevotellaceae bacterium]